MSDVVWTESFRVRSSETDPAGAVSVPAVCNWLQEVASNHAQELGVSVEQLTGRGLTWVLARLHLQLEAYPRWRDTVRVETWPAGMQGRYAIREYLILRDGALIGRGTSAWSMIDLRRRRPARLPAEVTALPLPERDRALADPFDPLPSPGGADVSARVQVRHSDLDLNQHVNNVRYIVWGLDALPAGWLRAHRLAALEVQFRAETTEGEEVGVQAEQGPSPDTWHHRVFHAAGERDAALLRTRWRAAPPPRNYFGPEP